MDIRKYARIFLNIAVPLVTIYLICVWGPRFLGFFLPFVIGWVVAMIANPLIRFLEKKIRILRRHSSMVLIVGVLALVIFGLYFLGSRGLRELVLFVRALPGLYAEVQEDVTAAYGELEQVLTFLPPEIKDTFGRVIEQLGTYIGGFLQDLAASAGGVVARTLPDVLVHTIVVLLSSYLFLAEHDVIVQRIRDVMPGAVKRYVGLIKKDVRQVIGGYFLAQFKIMFVVALVLMGGLLLLGVRYWAVLAVAIALLDFLPMFGTGTVLIPWAAVKLFTGDFAYAAGLGLLYILSQAVRQIIQPKIVGDSMGLPPLTTLFFLFLGYRIRGLAGMILAVPVGLIFIKFYEYGAFDSLINSVKELAGEIEEIRHGDGKEP